MEFRTDGASTNDWLGKSRDFRIAANIENIVSTLSIPTTPLPRENLYEALRKASVLLKKPSPIIEDELHLEFQIWDSLSDEALVNFEQQLINNGSW